jgi:hypothetical protein
MVWNGRPLGRALKEVVRASTHLLARHDQERGTRHCCELESSNAMAHIHSFWNSPELATALEYIQYSIKIGENQRVAAVAKTPAGGPGGSCQPAAA